MAFKFLVYVDSRNTAWLCEGGVYSDDSAILASHPEDYCDNDFAAAERELERLTESSGVRDWQSASGIRNRSPYQLRGSFNGIHFDDLEVIASLVAWQKAACGIFEQRDSHCLARSA